MSFFIGLGLTALLTAFAFTLFKMRKFFKPEFSLALIAIMIFGDGLLAMFWFYGLKDIVEVVKEFRVGIGASFVLVTMFKAYYLVMSSKEIEI